ncbi:deleted in malignant brain tumors 1 -like, partial [Paramuricea clavata]
MGSILLHHISELEYNFRVHVHAFLRKLQQQLGLQHIEAATPSNTCTIVAQVCTGLFLLRNNTCVEYCPEGTFYNELTKFCDPCDSNCRACSAGKDHCTACPPGLFLSGIPGAQKITTCLLRCSGEQHKILRDPGIRINRISYSIGRVELWQDREGRLTTVCPYNWVIKQAAVICRQLGYGDPVKAYTQYYDSNSSLGKFSITVQCNGTELSECDLAK